MNEIKSYNIGGIFVIYFIKPLFSQENIIEINTLFFNGDQAKTVSSIHTKNNTVV